MVLHQANFEIPARFSFQPFPAEWRFVTAETVDWAEDPTKLRSIVPVPAENDDDKNWLRVRIEVREDDNVRRMLAGLFSGIDPSYMVLMDRASIPPGVLQSYENHRNTPDISGRSFRVLIYRNPEIKLGLWALLPGNVTKNAWIMRDEFLSLEAHPRLGWESSVQRFLNKWGLWRSEQGYVKAWDFSSSYSNLTMLAALGSGERTDTPDFLIVMPHLLKAQQEWYRKALLPKSARSWLRSHPLHPLKFTPADEFPFFRVRSSYCRDAIEATITIDHLAERQFGICKRCHNVFQRETRHEKNYCSERCFNAAGVQRWREKQRKAIKKGAKRNAKG